MALSVTQNTEQRTMRLVMFYVFLSLFVILTVLTILTLFFGLTQLKDKYETLLVNTFIVEIGTAIAALFYGLFGLRRQDSTTQIQSKISGPIRVYISAKENGLTYNTIYSAYYETFNEDTGEKKLTENVPIQWEAGNFLWFSVKEASEDIYLKIGIRDGIGKKWESDHIAPKTFRFEKLHEL